ncbi:MAG: hypothetical protein IT374_11385 [Polyangiaceae bacterium]|nr:hypothetical protein [Polyangiaceae bacterium]
MKLRSPLALAVVLTLGIVAVGCGKKDSADPSAAAAAGQAATAKPVTPVATHTAPVSHDADAAAIRGCCASLRSEAAKQTSPADKSKYEAAAATCDGIAGVVKSGGATRAGALGSVRAALRGGALPAGCN